MTGARSGDGALVELLRHKTWATLQLIERCRGLDDEALDATVAGTYGTIRETLRHLVEAEEGYYRILTGERPGPPFPDGPVPLDELAARIVRLGPRWDELAEDVDLSGREVTSTDGWRFPGWVPLAQAIHHADDHRTHVLTILGARGLDASELSIWEYAEAVGAMHEIDHGPNDRAR